jgi:putative aldouronate transport system substrate-binding protein
MDIVLREGMNSIHLWVVKFLRIVKNAVFVLITLCILVSAVIYLRNNHSEADMDKTTTEEVVIKWMLYGEKHKGSERIFEEFNNQLKIYFPNTRIEFEVIPRKSYKEKWDMKMATNEVIDLAWIGNDVFNYTEEVKKGSFMALDYLLDTYGVNLKREISMDLWELQKNEGNMYSIPIPGILYRKGCALVVNKELDEPFGSVEGIGRLNRSKQYTDQECYDAFELFLARAKDAGIIGKGLSYMTFSQIADKGYEGIYGSDSPFIIKIFDKELKVYNKYEQDSWRLYFKEMAEWYQKGYIREDIADILDPLREDGKLKGSIMFLDDYREQGAAVGMVATEYEAAVEPLEAYKYISYGACRNSIVIPKSSKHPQQAMELINFLISEKGMDMYRLLTSGIEGQQIVENSSKKGEVTPKPIQIVEKYNKNPLVSPLSGFELDTRMIILEMSKVDLVVDEYKERLCQGTTGDWEKIYEEFVGKMKKAGSDKVIQEMQKQVDRFMKEK